MAGAAVRAPLGLVAIILLAGGIVLQFFVILSGIERTPLNKFYFLQASTDGLGGNNGVTYKNPARWTYLAICGVANGLNADCTPKGADIPFDPVRNFATMDGVPQQFMNQNYWFYLSRFSWAFYLIALFFAVVAFLLSGLALCSRLGGFLNGFFAMTAVFFQALAAALMTAWVVKGRNAWRANGNAANIGRYNMGFSWGAFAAFFLASVLFCIGGSVGKDKSKQKNSYFGRKRSTRSRGSFIDSSSDRRVVKDEYD